MYFHGRTPLILEAGQWTSNLMVFHENRGVKCRQIRCVFVCHNDQSEFKKKYVVRIYVVLKST